MASPQGRALPAVSRSTGLRGLFDDVAAKGGPAIFLDSSSLGMTRAPDDQRFLKKERAVFADGQFFLSGLWCRGPDLNRRPQLFQSCALPTELPRHGNRRTIVKSGGKEQVTGEDEAPRRELQTAVRAPPTTSVVHAS